MGFKRYQINIILRLALVAINCYGISYVLQLHTYWFTLWNLILFLVLQIFLLFRFLTRWQTDLRVFANSVKHGDYNITYHLLHKNDAHYELYDMLNQVTRYVREVKSEYVQQNHYFQYVVENTQVGLLAWQDDGKIVLVNNEALKLTGHTELKNLNLLKQRDPSLYQQISLLEFHQPRLITGSKVKGLKLSARLTRFVIDGMQVSLLSLMNIRPELEENELQSWQELISVLTHEIMNSITPIHSLNGSMAKYLNRIEGNEEIVKKAKDSLEVINRRSQSLMHFVDRYRKISAVPLPHRQSVEVASLIRSILTLLQHDLSGVRVTVDHHDERIQADPSQVEQVMINLLRNAAFALDGCDKKEISISVNAVAGETRISVTDSGKGMTSEVMDKIFIPFYTTRPEGSGIGLTLSRQMMHRHGGAIEVFSEPGRGSTFTMVFP